MSVATGAGEAALVAMRVLVVDDDPLSRRALQGLLATLPGITVAGEGANAVEATEQVAALAPDVVLMDVQMAGLDGIELTRALLQHHPDLKVLILSVLPEDPYALKALKAGARGYLHKRDVGTQLEAALARVASGETYLAPSVAPELLQRLISGRTPGGGGAADLTPRELEVLRWLATGASNKEIAVALGITPRTVKAHVSRILEKLGLQDRFQAALHALRSGIVPAAAPAEAPSPALPPTPPQPFASPASSRTPPAAS